MSATRADDAATDLVAVEGNAVLGGDLLVTLAAANASPGQRWTIMTFASRSGNSYASPRPDVPAGMRLTPFYFSDRIELVLQQEQSYDDWRGLHPFDTGADSQASADPDGDGWQTSSNFSPIPTP